MPNYIATAGRLGGSPEPSTVTTQAGETKRIAKARLAVQPDPKGETTWYDVTFWEEKADWAVRNLGKGSGIGVQGKLTEREYNGKTYKAISASWVTGGDSAPSRPRTDELPF